MHDLLFGPGPIVAVQELFGPRWVGVFRAVTYLGTTVGLLPLVAVSFWLWGRKLAYELVVVAVLGLAISALLWVTLGVPRPDHPSIRVYDEVSVASLPSGHVVTATTLWSLLAIRRRVHWLLALGAVGVESLSRLYLGAHHLGDVLAGALIGLTIVALAQLIWPGVVSWASHLSLRAYVAVGGLGFAVALIGLLLQSPDASGEALRTLGTSVGGLAAATLEYALVRYSPDDISRRTRRRGVVLGLVVLVLPLLVSVNPVGGPFRALAVSLPMTLGAVWAILLVPTLLNALGRQPSTRRSRW